MSDQIGRWSILFQYIKYNVMTENEMAETKLIYLKKKF